MNIRSEWLKKIVGKVLIKIISKKAGIELSDLCIHDFSITEDSLNDEYVMIDLNVTTVVKKADIMSLIGGKE